jgi:hypothetical protein
MVLFIFQGISGIVSCIISLDALRCVVRHVLCVVGLCSMVVLVVWVHCSICGPALVAPHGPWGGPG